MSASHDSPKVAKKVDQMETKAGAAPARLAKVVGQVLATGRLRLASSLLGASKC